MRGVGMRARQLLLRSLLLIALALMATVPSGMMRIKGDGGMRLVLCTGDGPQEVWLDARGIPSTPEHEDHHSPRCVQVHLTAPVPGFVPVVAQAELQRQSLAVAGRNQIHARLPFVWQSGPRAPPVSI